MSKTVSQRLQLTLKSYASKLEAGTLPPDETAKVVDLIRRLAKGESLDDIFQIWRPANRPLDPNKEERMWEMADLTLPKLLGGAGLGVDQALKLTAERYGRKVSTLRRQYYSSEGVEIRGKVKKRGQMIAELRDPAPWRGAETAD